MLNKIARRLSGILCVLAFLLFATNEVHATMLTEKLFSDATATGAKASQSPPCKERAYHLTGSVSASTGAAGVTLETSNDNVNWVSAGTMALTLGTTVTSDTLTSDVPWRYVRGNVTSISGTDATVTLWISCERQ